MNTRAVNAGAGSSLSRFYFVIWLALGAAGIFYLTIATLAPEALRNADAGQSTSIEATNQKVATLSTNLNSVKSSIDATQTKQQAMASGLESLRSEVSGIKVKLNDLGTLGQTTATRVSSLEGKPVPVAGGKVQGQAATLKPRAAVVPAIVGEVVPLEDTAISGPSSEAAAEDLVPSAPAKKPAKVASVAPVSKDPNKDPAANKPYAVNLAVSTSTDALRQIWQLFKDQHGELLSGLNPRSATSGSNVRLLAGPFPNQAAATNYCTKLRNEGMSCTPTPMAGTPL